uniref:Uncharacterized protein n=1 Tax=Avena sativa TaxID=4498 RepID=A0ACD6AIW3_AVESA
MEDLFLPRILQTPNTANGNDAARQEIHLNEAEWERVREAARDNPLPMDASPSPREPPKMATTATAMAMATTSPAAPVVPALFFSLPQRIRVCPKPLISTSRRLVLPVPKSSSWAGSASEQEDGDGVAEDTAEATSGEEVEEDEDDEKPQPEAVSSSEFQFAAPPEGYIEPAPFDELPPESPEDVAAAYEALYGPAFSGESLMGNNVFEVKVVDPVDMDRDQRPNDDFSERVVQVSRVTKMQLFVISNYSCLLAGVFFVQAIRLAIAYMYCTCWQV